MKLVISGKSEEYVELENEFGFVRVYQSEFEEFYNRIKDKDQIDYLTLLQQDFKACMILPLIGIAYPEFDLKAKLIRKRGCGKAEDRALKLVSIPREN